MPKEASSPSNLAVITPEQVRFDASKTQFQLFKLTSTGWNHVKKIEGAKSRVTVMIHGFKIGRRDHDFGISSQEIALRLGLTDFTDCQRPIRKPPPETLVNHEVYALAWNSVAPSPWELELLMGGKIDLHRFMKNPADYKSALGQDPFDQPQNVEIYRLLEQFYNQITHDVHNVDIHFAGFSKGGHMAIKLAQIHKSKQRKQNLRALYLLDPYVGPAVLNGGLGTELLAIIKGLKKEDVNIVNIETSQVSQAGDRHFYDTLRQEVGQLVIKRNPMDQERTKSYRNLMPVRPVAELYLDHFRAPQYFLGSTLACDGMLPTIKDPGTIRRGTIQNPQSVSEWIYAGIVRAPQCQVKDAQYF